MRSCVRALTRTTAVSWHWLCAPVRYSGHPVARWGHQTLAMPWRINCLHRTAMTFVAMHCTWCARQRGYMVTCGSAARTGSAVIERNAACDTHAPRLHVCMCVCIASYRLARCGKRFSFSHALFFQPSGISYTFVATAARLLCAFKLL